ncbi:MAG TPA: helix-turn-helix domain-containing protein [Allosphingosinicella sp.]
MSFGARLAEERKRLGLKQAEFASLVGTDVPKQSLYENDRRELRADYLARLASADVDVIYVLTGHRTEGVRLNDQATRLLSASLCLPEPTQRTLAELAETIRQDLDRGTPRTFHSRPHEYRAAP